MRRDRNAVATYLQTFVLISVALASSVLAYKAFSGYVGSEAGASVILSGTAITQEAQFAIERLTVSNAGAVSLPSFTLLNPSVSEAVEYCYALNSPNGTEVSGNCPGMKANPSSIELTTNIAPGGSFVLVVVFRGEVFVPGKSYPVVVAAAGGAVASQQVVATQG